MTFEAIEQLTDKQIEDLHKLYQQEWWTKGRQLADIRRMLRHCDLIVAFCDSDNKRLVGFARVITDFVYKALVLDVIVEATYRKSGLGRALMDAIVEHPSLKYVQHFELYCLPEMIPFYQKWGFTEALGDLQFMRRSK